MSQSIVWPSFRPNSNRAYGINLLYYCDAGVTPSSVVWTVPSAFTRAAQGVITSSGRKQVWVKFTGGVLGASPYTFVATVTMDDGSVVEFTCSLPMDPV